MLRSEKATVIDGLHDALKASGVVVVTHYKGLTVAEITQLRAQVRAAGASFRVTKNSLTKLALKDTDYAGLDGLFEGPTAIAVSSDPVAAPKVVAAFAKKNDKLKIVGGGLGATVLDEAAVRSLAELPSLDELRAKLLSLLNTPASRIVGILQAPGGQIARVLAAHAEKGGDA
ncbi:MAG: 50S ribosomal protein L10 [Geminicoccaceae bacterium]|nr:50S ribosomal protein L10 [Geminicoccaceae bacterium]